MISSHSGDMTGKSTDVSATGKCGIKTIGVIPARWGSTRFPGKSLAPLCGKPLIQWVVERARAARKLEEVVVATDDERIRRVVEGFGGRAVMTAAGHPSGTDRVAEAVKRVAPEAEIVVNIQGDEPLIEPSLIDRLVGIMLEETCWDMATAAAPVRDEEEARRASVCKVVFNAAGQALYFSRWPIPFIREESFRKSVKQIYWRHIGIYLYRKPFLAKLISEPPCLIEQAECLEQLRALHLGGRIKVVQTEQAGPGVDTPEDVALVEAALNASNRDAGGTGV